MTGRAARAVIAGALLAACAPRHRPVPVPPAPPAIRDAGGVHVLLTWAAPVDLDLYVTDPAGETLYFANNPTRAGARLEQDARCGALAGGAAIVEHARLAAPVPGRYRVGVDFIDACGVSVGGVPFRVRVDCGAAYREAEDAVGLGEFKIVVLEFDVTEDGDVTGGLTARTSVEAGVAPAGARSAPGPILRTRRGRDARLHWVPAPAPCARTQP